MHGCRLFTLRVDRFNITETVWTLPYTNTDNILVIMTLFPLKFTLLPLHLFIIMVWSYCTVHASRYSLFILYCDIGFHFLFGITKWYYDNRPEHYKYDTSPLQAMFTTFDSVHNNHWSHASSFIWSLNTVLPSYWDIGFRS